MVVLGQDKKLLAIVKRILREVKIDKNQLAI